MSGDTAKTGSSINRTRSFDAQSCDWWNETRPKFRVLHEIYCEYHTETSSSLFGCMFQASENHQMELVQQHQDSPNLTQPAPIAKNFVVRFGSSWYYSLFFVTSFYFCLLLHHNIVCCSLFLIHSHSMMPDFFLNSQDILFVPVETTTSKKLSITGSSLVYQLQPAACSLQLTRI
jgi:hypothetical protein